jgi:hypothetical protein
MVAYEFYWLDPEGRFRRIGVLPERRKSPMRITMESIMNWGKMFLGNDVDKKNIFFKWISIDNHADRILWHDLSNHLIDIIN